MTPVQAVAVCAAGIRRHARRIAATIITLGFFAALALAVLLGWATVFEGCLVVFVVLVVGWLLWLTFELFGLHERTDDNTDGVDRALSDAHAARDEADQARAGVLAVHDHLAGSEPAGAGRHAVTPSRGANGGVER